MSKAKKASPKPTPLAADWRGEDWEDRCAWCGQTFPRKGALFGITVRLHPDAFKVFNAGTIQPLYLGSLGRVVPMTVVTDDSLAKSEGKDAVFQLCSEACAQSLQAALKKELGAG